MIVRQRGGQRQRRRHHRIVKLAAQSGAGQLPGLTLERVAGLRRRGAHKQREFDLFPVRFHMRVLVQIVHQCTGAGTVGQPTISAVRAEVFAAEAVLGEAPQEAVAPIVTGVGHQQLVGFRPQPRPPGVDRRFQIADRPQAVHIPLAEQIAALHHFSDQLFEADALPLALAALADALHRLQHA